MRKWHRWLSVLFGILILFIAITGVASQFAALYANGGFEKSGPRPGPDKMAGPAGSPAAGASANGERRPPATPARKLVGFLHHLHSGETFGPAGTVISILSGFALIFFAISGMWMYVQMFLRRKTSPGRGRFFWK